MPSGTSRRYDELCADYGLIASRNNPSEAHAECRAFVDQLVARRDRRREAAVRGDGRTPSAADQADHRLHRDRRPRHPHRRLLVHGVFYSAPAA
jgi:hypothetical protein